MWYICTCYYNIWDICNSVHCVQKMYNTFPNTPVAATAAAHLQRAKVWVLSFLVPHYGIKELVVEGNCKVKVTLGEAGRLRLALL